MSRRWDALGIGALDRALIGGGAAALVAAWPVFVFTGAQAAYLVATLGACLAAVGLIRRRTPLAVGFLVGLLALVGSDVNGQLGKGTPPLGSLRILDLALAAAALTAAWVDRGELRRLSVRSRPGGLAILGGLAVVYVTLRWATAGHPVDSFLRTDLRLLVVAALTSFVARRCRSGPGQAIGWSLVVVGALAAAKAVAVHVSGLFAIGSNDRVQATSTYAGDHVRTILVGGGDTLLILVPALAILLAAQPGRVARRAFLAVAGFGCLAALGLSGTRTSLLVSFGLAVVAAGCTFASRRSAIPRRSLLTAAAIGVAALAVATLGQAPQRLLQKDAPHTGLDFRRDEVKTFFKLPAGDQLLGRGLASRLRTADTQGNPVLSGWTHELPFWIALKAGVIGVLLAALAYGLIVRRGIAALRGPGDRTVVLAGQLLILGLVVMSMTINRLGLVEGAMLLPIAVLLAGAPPGSASAPEEKPPG